MTGGQLMYDEGRRELGCDETGGEQVNDEQGELVCDDRSKS
jgi:hypothetical protein